MKNTIDELEDRRYQAQLSGGQNRIDKQHVKGKITTHERLKTLIDQDSFEEYDTFKVHRCVDFNIQSQQYAEDGVIMGFEK